MTIPDWESFYHFTKDSPPWPLLMRAATLAARIGHRALDLGAGAGRDTRYLLEQGFHVTAVDTDRHAVALLSALPPAHLRVVQSSFEDFDFTAATYDLISAQFALPFLPSDRFAGVFARLKAALTPGGIFAGQFFGIHDDWNTPERAMTFLTRSEAEGLLSDLDLIELREEDTDGHVADGSPKHWHVFHILARRPSSERAHTPSS